MEEEPTYKTILKDTATRLQRGGFFLPRPCRRDDGLIEIYQIGNNVMVHLVKLMIAFALRFFILMKLFYSYKNAQLS